MTRIPPLEILDEEQAALLAATFAAPDGSPLNLFATLVRWPELMRRLAALGGYFFAQGALTGAQRELAILRIAALLDSEYVLAQHRVLAADMGIDAREVAAALESDGRTPAWGAGELALLDLVGDLVASGGVGDSTWATAITSLGEDATVETVFLVGHFRMLAGFLSAAQVPVDPATLEVLAARGARP